MSDGAKVVKLVGLRVTREVHLNMGKESYSSVKIGATPYFELKGHIDEDLPDVFEYAQDLLRDAIGEQLAPFLPYVQLYKNGDDGVHVEVEELFLGKPVEKD